MKYSAAPCTCRPQVHLGVSGGRPGLDTCDQITHGHHMRKGSAGVAIQPSRRPRAMQQPSQTAMPNSQESQNQLAGHHGLPSHNVSRASPAGRSRPGRRRGWCPAASSQPLPPGCWSRLFTCARFFNITLLQNQSSTGRRCQMVMSPNTRALSRGSCEPNRQFCKVGGSAPSSVATHWQKVQNTCCDIARVLAHRGCCCR